MKETGMLFTSPMVRAILEGRKTQTRRVAKEFVGRKDLDNILHRFPKQRGGQYGEPGDRIYVRESFVQGYEEDPLTGRLKQWDDEGNLIPLTTWFRATNTELMWSDDGESEVNVPWKPATHMPKELARIWLEVTGVRVERLHTITEADAVRDGGLHRLPATGRYVMNQGDQYFGLATHDPRELFREIWESTGGDWAANPWVWVVDFKVLSTTGRPA